MCGTPKRGQRLKWLAQHGSGLDHHALLHTYRTGSDAHAGAALRTATRVAAVGSVPEEAAAKLFAELVSRMCEATAAPTLLHDMVKAAAQVPPPWRLCTCAHGLLL